MVLLLCLMYWLWGQISGHLVHTGMVLTDGNCPARRGELQSEVSSSSGPSSTQLFQEAFGSGQPPVPVPTSLLSMADDHKVIVGVWSSRKTLLLIAFLPLREPDSKAACVGLHPTEGSSSTLFGKIPSTP